MKIYHGTSHSRARRAASFGLAPRNQFELPLNIKNEGFASNPDMVYLTTTYALYSACASDETQVAVVEIETDELDKEKFYPDEDFICEFVKRRNRYFQIEEEEEELFHYVKSNPEMFRGYWSESLQMLGNICYKGSIPANAIIRYAIFDLELFSDILAASMMDTETVCITNHVILGRFYKQFIAWLFDEVRELPHVKELMNVISNIEDKKSDVAIHFKKQVELFRVLQKKRDGIKIVNL